ncbi:MAG: cyclic pyranopterin monophosphate synthase MoaC [Planctomycetota bacterium]|jgi:cyclic pyranopterin phosphate synthase
MSKPKFSHLDDKGQARMVDVSQKASSRREARARARVELGEEVRAALLAGELPKGEALAMARLAGIQAAKETSRLIPLCHPLALSVVEVTFEPVAEAAMEVRSLVRCVGPTGVEMEALTAVTVAALTLYDMCKALSRDIRITGVELCAKSGGRSGDWHRDQDRDPNQDPNQDQREAGA